MSSSRVIRNENMERIQEKGIKVSETEKKFKKKKQQTKTQTPCFIMKGLVKSTLNSYLTQVWKYPTEENIFETRELFNLAIKGVTRSGGWKLKLDKFDLKRRHIPTVKGISH